MICITTNAKTALRSYAISQGLQAVLLNLQDGGCTGYRYQLTLVNEINQNQLSYDLGEGSVLLVSPADAQLIEGLVIDYVVDGPNRKFVYHNPNATAWCGCGESFRV